MSNEIRQAMRQARRDSGLVFAVFAREAQFAEGYLRSVENGRRSVTQDVAHAYDRVLRTGGRFAAMFERRNARYGTENSDGVNDWPPEESHAHLLPADHGLTMPWTQDGFGELAEDWTSMQRRAFLKISGAALTTPAWAALEQPVPFLGVDRHGGRVNEGMLQIIEQTVGMAQQLDDARGSSGMRFVIDTAGTVTAILKRDSYDDGTGRRLATALARLSQTAAFMAYESRYDGLAQRLYLAGLRAAHAADDPSLAASVMGLMSNQSTALGRAEDALQLAAAAHTAARDSSGPVRALVAARASLAHAAAGDMFGFERASEAAHDMLAMNADREVPSWAYYVSDTEIDAMTGRGMVALARRLSPTRTRSRLLERAVPLLHDRAFMKQPQFARSALRHSAWLALAHSASSDLDQALSVGYHALGLLPDVMSGRSLGLLHRLMEDLRPHADSQEVGTFLADLEFKLATAA